jgi:hypothetical protein
MVPVGECLGDPAANWYKTTGPVGVADSTWTC